jgi:membrane protease YdiL (CAAX protease family)
MNRQTPSGPGALLVAGLGFLLMLLVGGLLAGLAALYLLLTTGGVDERELMRLSALGLPLQGMVMIGAVVLLARRSTDGLSQALALRPGRRWWLVPLVVPVGVVSDAVVQLAQGWLPVLDQGGLDSLNDALLGSGVLGTVLVALGAVVTAPIAEELLFRGYVFRGLQRGWGTLLAVLVSGLFFALYHADPLHIVGVLVIGLYLGWLRHLTDSLWACIAAHALNNAIWVGFTATVGLVPEIPWWVTLCCVAVVFVPMAGLQMSSYRDERVTS